MKAWHNATDAAFDFSEDNCRLEVKTTTLRNRKHSFGLHQVFPKGSVNLIIASLMIEKVPIGLSLGDLIDKIEKTLTDAEQKLKFDQLITETLGESYEKSLEEAYDETSAKELLEFFDIQDIPKIPQDTIPKEISDVRFSVSLDDINTVSKKNFRGLSDLFDSVLS